MPKHILLLKTCHTFVIIFNNVEENYYKQLESKIHFIKLLLNFILELFISFNPKDVRIKNIYKIFMFYIKQVMPKQEKITAIGIQEKITTTELYFNLLSLINPTKILKANKI